MTPLAQHLLNDWCSPIKDRRVADPHGVLRRMTEAKCFECTALVDFAHQMMCKTVEGGVDGNLSQVIPPERLFLPAPVTFLELMTPEGPLGFLLMEDERGNIAFYVSIETELSKIGTIIVSKNARDGDSYLLADIMSSTIDEVREEMHDSARNLLYALLFLRLINTPHLLGNITHLPHAGLQKKIARQLGMVGKFPLRAWTEITLFVDLTGAHAEAENSEIEARLSGQKCLHFVRAFLRWRLGRLEFVHAHWRGDGSLGIKRSRYITKVAA
jgi:hypothetical protein